MLEVVVILLKLVGAVGLLLEFFGAEWAISRDACECFAAVEWDARCRELKVTLLNVSER